MSTAITQHIQALRTELPENVTLVCVSKFHPVEAIREAYEAGERHFGESRVQELKTKIPQLPTDIHWHFIGHLQTNKVRDLLKLRPYLIHSVDSERLLQALQDEAAKLGIIQDILLEVHVAKEETKSGFTLEEISNIQYQISNYQNIHVRGLMCMATNTDDEAEIRRCFDLTARIASDLTAKRSNSEAVFQAKPVLSMGMSDDFRIAIECGSNMVRIGSTIFGNRAYPTPKPSMQTLKAVFFDQDGVLFNSMPFHAKSWELAMTENGMPFSAEQTYRNEGRTGASVIQENYRAIHGVDAPQEVIEAVYAAKSDYFNRLTGGKLPDLIPGVRELLSFLHQHGIQCWVVTGSGQRSLLNNLCATFEGILQPDHIISAFDVQHGKPHPEPYLKAWERSGFRKEECMVVENAPLGTRAGKAAGLFVAAVNTGPLPDSDLTAEGADRVFPTMHALLEWLQQN